MALALLGWLPIAAWALLTGRASHAGGAGSLFAHYGINAICLGAIPLLVLCEGVAHDTLSRVLPQFLESGVVGESERGRFQTVLSDLSRLRNATLPWVVIGGACLGLSLTAHPIGDALAWAQLADGRLGFGGSWYLMVVRPLHLGLLLAWIWRLLLVTLLCLRLSRLELNLVPTHPDRSGGLGFLEALPEAFSLLALSLSTVLCAGWTFELVQQRVSLSALRFPLGVFLVTTTLVLMMPLLAFTPQLLRTRRRALRDYGALLAHHGRLVERRWIRGEPVPDTRLLEAPELGPSVDIASIYEAVRLTRRCPVSRTALLRVLVPLLLPVLGAITTQIPVAEILRKVGQALL